LKIELELISYSVLAGARTSCRLVGYSPLRSENLQSSILAAVVHLLENQVLKSQELKLALLISQLELSIVLLLLQQEGLDLIFFLRSLLQSCISLVSFLADHDEE